MPLLKGSINIKFGDLQARLNKSTILGIAHGSRKDGVIFIEIDRDNWAKMNELQRTAIMYHELSHDILNAKHTENEKDLMYPSYKLESTSDLILAMTEIFKMHKNNTLERFQND